MKITFNTIEFPCEIKNKIIKLVNTSKITIDFINGRTITINKTNLALEQPCRVVFSNNDNYFEVLIYEGSDYFYVENSTTTLSLTSLVKLINNSLN